MSDEGRHGHPLPFAPMCWECWADKTHTAESQNQALQERAEKAEAYLLVIADGVWNEPHIRKVEGRDLNISVEQFARSALSPTQETDPE